MEKSTKIAIGTLALCGTILAEACLNGRFGIEKITQEYSGKFNGKPLEVIKAHIKFGPDKCWATIKDHGIESYIDHGSIVSDEHKRIYINGNNVSINEPGKFDEYGPKRSY